MTNKERVHAVLTGRPADRSPVTSLYNFLYHEDHFAELAELPQWQMSEWLAAEPAAHLAVFRQMHEKAPFELLQPQGAPPREWRERQEFVRKDNRPFRHDKRTDEWSPLDNPTVSGHATDNRANETQFVFDKRDIDANVKAQNARDAIAIGYNDYLDAVVGEFGAEEFILSGGVVGTLYSCSRYLGLTNLLAMLLDNPNLVEYLCRKMLEVNIETIRRFAAAGGDAIYIDDAIATNDMVSIAHFERFSLPYMQTMTQEIHRLGHKAIIIYYGGIADRLEQIAAIGADGLVMEASMKGYVNDIHEIVSAIGKRLTLFANIDPVSVLQNGSDEELAAEIRRQTKAGLEGRGLIIATPSPITPSTPLLRVRRFLELGRGISAELYASATELGKPRP